MRLKLDVSFEGREDIEFMTTSLKGLLEFLLDKMGNEPSISMMLPLGTITISKENQDDIYL